MRKPLIALTAVACAALLIVTARAERPKRPADSPGFTIQKLDDLNGWYIDTVARDINSRREIVGYVDDPIFGEIAAYWSPDGSIHELISGLGAEGINEFGEIVGAGIDASDSIIGLYWSGAFDQNPLSLWPLSGDDESAAYGINRNGVICGYSRRHIYGPDPQVLVDPPTVLLRIESHAVVWRTLDGSVQGPFKLPGLLESQPTADPDEEFSTASAINENDGDGVATVVGLYMPSSLGQKFAVAWTVNFEGDGQIEAVARTVDNDSIAYGVSNSDKICGESWASGETTEAVIWTGRTSRALGRTKYVFTAWANDVNDADVVVGTGEYWKNFEQGLRAVVWQSPNGPMKILDDYLSRNSPFDHLNHASAVNQVGEIVGIGWDGVATKAFLAIPDVSR